jgi:hypothetical protein
MTKAEFESLGLTTEQYKEMFDEEPIIEDEAQATEAAVETPAETVAETTVEAPEMVQEDATKAEETVAAIVPAEAKAEVVATGAAMSFANIKAAAEFLAEQKGLKVSNTLDGLYKTKRRGTNKTHGYAVQYNDDKSVVLTPIA